VNRVAAWPLLALIRLYRTLISPVLPAACRYYPSCSQYAEEAVRLHGPLIGAWLALRRLLRCLLFAEGGPDPVPPRGLGDSRVG
jgi:putative membrane protein insertion efficiency factor